MGMTQPTTRSSIAVSEIIHYFSPWSAQAAHARMTVILDGVFNYTSSDSVYFDLYKRYTSGIGACESTPSTPSYYRDWYFFYDVAPGTGPCTSSDGTENGADYLSWQGNDQPAFTELLQRESTRTILENRYYHTNRTLVAQYLTERMVGAWILAVKSIPALYPTLPIYTGKAFGKQFMRLIQMPTSLVMSGEMLLPGSLVVNGMPARTTSSARQSWASGAMSPSPITITMLAAQLGLSTHFCLPNSTNGF